MNESHRAMLRTHGTLVGRILLALLFVVSGVMILINGPEGTAGYYSMMGVPAAGIVVWLVIAIKIGAGAALMLGYRVGLAASALILFTIGATLFGHTDFSPEMMQTNMTALLKNLSIIGGLFYVMAYGAGEGWSLDKSKPAPESSMPDQFSGTPQQL